MSTPRFPVKMAMASVLGLLVLTARPLLAGQTLSAGSTAAAPGSAAAVPVTLAGNGTGVALQFDLAFDSSVIGGVTATANAAAAGHILVSGQPTNGILRVILYSLSNALLQNGALIDLRFTVNPGLTDRLTTLQVTNALLADANGTALSPLALQAGALTISTGAGSRLTLVARLANGQVQLLLSGTTGQRYVLQSSPDLAHWFDLSTYLLVAGQTNLTDLTATNSSQRYYRAKYAP